MNRQTIPFHGRIVWDREINTPLPRETDPKKDVAFFGPWIGELGWELLTWQGWCRYMSRYFKKCYVSSFHDMGFLYCDFATFMPHDYPKRVLDWRDISGAEHFIPDDVTMQLIPHKKYIVEPQEFIKFGEMQGGKHGIFLHARGINKGGKNYDLTNWKELVFLLQEYGFLYSVGTEEDHWIEGTADLRGISLTELANHFAGAKCVVGQSSGVMHFATLCGAPIVAWGDKKTYFNQLLGERYETTWNPFSTPVSFLYDNRWQPRTKDVYRAIKDRIYNRLPQEKGGEMSEAKVPVPGELRNILLRATKNKKWMCTVHWMEGDTLKHFWITRDFPKNEMHPSMDHIKKDMESGGVKPKKIIHAPVERAYKPGEAPPEEGPPKEPDPQPEGGEGNWI